MVLNADSVDGVTVVLLPERINSSNNRAFEKDVAPLMDENRRLIFDLSRVTQLDSSGLGSLVACLKHVRSAQGDLKLCGMSRQIRTLFELVRMHHVFDIYNNRQEAVEAYK
jgi:anti-sigma B factor antagonist